MKTNSKIYLAGHNGLVGSALYRAFEKGGYTKLITRSLDELDLKDQIATREFFQREQPEYVFLAAAKVGGIHANNTFKAEFIYDNLVIAANVTDAAYRSRVKKLLNLGSSCIYPKLALQPMKEEYLLTGALEPTNEPYAIAKIAAIKLCRYYNEQYGTNFISVMPTNLYGPGDNFDLEQSHVLPALVRKMHLAKLLMTKDFDAIAQDIRKRPLTKLRMILSNSKDEMTSALEQFGITRDRVVLWGTGSPFREFLYSDDLAAACLFLMERYDYKQIGEFINIGCGEDQRISEIALLVREVVGYKGEIVFDKIHPDGTPRKLLDTSRIKNLGWSPKYSIREGMEKYYGWYKRQ
ncbi:MAG: GDP-L-fucose synthase [bacterium]